MAEDINDIKKQIEDLNKRVASLGGDFYKDVNQAIASFGGGIKGAEQALKGLQKEMNNVNTDVNYLYNTLKNVTRELKGQKNANKDISTSYSKISSIANQLKHDQDGISELNKKQLISAAKKIQFEKTSLANSIIANNQRKAEILGILQNKDAREKLSAQELNSLRKEYTQIKANTAEAQAFYDDSENGIDSLAKATQKRLAEEIKIQQQMGLTGAVVDGIIGSLGKLGISSTFFEGIKDDMRDAAKSGGLLGGSLKAMGAGIIGLGKGISNAFTDPLAILTFIINAGLKADKQTTELAKSLGISKDQASGLRDNFAKYAISTGDAFVTTDKLMEAQGGLTNELGVAVQYTGKQAEDFSRLTKLMGLSASEAGKIARLSIVNGNSIEATTKSIIKGSAASQRANKISIEQSTILKDVANLSEGILIKFQGNPEALGAAVVQARALGLTLEQVDKVGESLLNFQSSIENELKAELLTGKQINLEKARYAALTGDQLTLTREVADQVGSLADFQNMNVLAQKSLAEAFGLSRDEVSKMLIEQEKVNKLGDASKMTLDQQLEALKAQGEPLDSVLYKQIQQQSAQEKFNNAIEKLQGIIGRLVEGPVGKLIDAFANILTSATGLYSILGLIATVSLVKMITGLTTALALKRLATNQSIKAAGADAAGAAANAAGSAAKIPGVGWLIAGGVAAALFGTLIGYLAGAKKGDDIMSEGGYGKRTLLSPEGAIRLNDNDTVIAGTNLGGGSNINRDSINKPMQPSFNTSAITDAISALSNTVSGLVNRPQATPQFALHVDGRQIGTAVGSQMETGTAQMMNTSYKVA
jgi:hypothetical protein